MLALWSSLFWAWNIFSIGISILGHPCHHDCIRVCKNFIKGRSLFGNFYGHHLSQLRWRSLFGELVWVFCLPMSYYGTDTWERMVILLLQTRDGVSFACLWSSPVANDVWLQSNLNMQKWDHSMHCFFDLMACVQARLVVEETQLFSCTAFLIWDSGLAQTFWRLQAMGSFYALFFRSYGMCSG